MNPNFYCSLIISTGAVESSYHLISSSLPLIASIVTFLQMLWFYWEPVTLIHWMRAQKDTQLKEESSTSTRQLVKKLASDRDCFGKMQRFGSQLIGAVNNVIALGAGGSGHQFTGWSNRTRCCQRLATAAKFLRSCVAQKLSCEDGPCHSLHASS